MNRIVPPIFALSIAVAASHAVAMPQFGRNCNDCHMGGPPPVEGAMEIIGFNGVADPDESGTGATDRGPLKFFDVQPGEAVDLSVRVDFQDAPDILYAVALKRMEEPGVENGGTLVQTPDPDWFVHVGDLNFDPDRPYFTIPDAHGIEFTEPRVFTFTMLVDAATDPDFYDLVFTVAGQPGFFYTDEHFYVHVVPEPLTLLLMAAGLAAVRRVARRRT